MMCIDLTESTYTPSTVILVQEGSVMALGRPTWYFSECVWGEEPPNFAGGLEEPLLNREHT